MPNILVGSVVSRRDGLPYIQIEIDGRMLQMSVAEARAVAQDIQTQAYRGEADAMLVRFFHDKDLPEGALNALLQDFRDFRARIDQENLERFQKSPEGT